MGEVISFLKVLDHERLCERLRALRPAALSARTAAPDASASPMLARAAAQLLVDIYRLLSREPGARALPRIDPRRPPDHRLLIIQLTDAQLALDLFRNAHLDHDGETGDEWLTIEGLDDRRSRRVIPVS